MTKAPSPFKFLDAYQETDVKVFFGRSKETTALYNALSGVKHLMVYGPSGSGKTSLVECGLRNRFSSADWFALTIRKGADINASLYEAINNALSDKIVLVKNSKLPKDSKVNFGSTVEKLFKERFQPIYLLFDQFEELLISGSPEEQEHFFENINALIHHPIPCKIMFIMREEFIGHLSEFESLCPSILENRFRVEKMGRSHVQEVIFQILEAPAYQSYYTVEDSQGLAEEILSKLPDKKKEIELSHVQVFLSELWDRAINKKKNQDLPILNSSLLKKTDNLEKILESFLKKQMQELEGTYGKGVPLELLATMISEKFTKLQLSESAIKIDLDHKNIIIKRNISGLLNELSQRRILRTLKVGDETQFEISHDSLALVVGQNLTDEMKMREKAADIYKVYEERQGLFSQEDIDYLRPYDKSLSLPNSLRQRINESQKGIEEQRKRAVEQKIADRSKKRKMRVLATGIVLLIGFGIVITYLALDAQKQKIIADEKKVEAEKATNYANELLQLVMKGRGDQYEKVSDSVLSVILYKERTYPLDCLIIAKGSISPSNRGGENRNYTLWIDVPSFRKNDIKEVQYRLCPEFIDRVRTSKDPSSSFSIGYLGYGYCPAGYDLYVITKKGDTLHRNIRIDEFIGVDP